MANAERVLLKQGVDIAAAKREAKIGSRTLTTAADLSEAWFERYIANKYQHPNVVERVLRRHIIPAIGKLPISDVQPFHVDRILVQIVAAGAPTVANDALRYLFRMFHFAVKRKLVDSNPVYGFELSDAGGTERSRSRWLNQTELSKLFAAMQNTPNFGRLNELAISLLLALCVRKMELLGAQWQEFDLEKAIWTLHPSRTKTNSSVEIPLAPAVIDWLNELKVWSAGSAYVFPARRLQHLRQGLPRKNRFPHVSPDTLNVALRRLPDAGIEHFTVHDMRRTGRTHMAALGIDRFVAERALNHKVPAIEGIYNRYDYFEERKDALNRWAMLLVSISRGEAHNEGLKTRHRTG